MRRSHFAYVVPVVLAVASAGAEETHLGAAHTMAVSIEGAISGYWVSPGVDYFVVDGLSIGLQVGFQGTFSDFPDLYSLFVAGRVGYALKLTDRVSFWPRLALEYDRTQYLTTAAMAVDATAAEDDLYASIFAPVVVDLTPHVFVGFGPYVSRALTSDYYGFSTYTTVRFDTIVGGWF